MKHLRNKISFFFLYDASPPYGVNASAQTGVRDATSGVKAFNDAATGFDVYFEPLTVLVYVVGAIVGLIGAIKVYQKFSFRRPGYRQSGRKLVRSHFLNSFSDCSTSILLGLRQGNGVMK